MEREYRSLRRAGGLRLMRCRCAAPRGTRAEDEQHHACSITLVERGHFVYRTRGGSAELSPGWLMLGNAGEGYVCSHEPNDGRGDDCAVLSLPPELLAEASSELGFDARFERAALPPSPRVAALVGTLLADGDEGFALEETTLAVIAHVQAALHDGAAPAALARHDERALAAARWIEQHAAEPIGLDDAAAAAGVGSFHLLRIFRRAIGVTPHQYLMRQRLLRALALLRDSALPVTEVAYEAGWSDLSNFTRTFHRDVGCAPGAYRRGGALRVSRYHPRP